MENTKLSKPDVIPVMSIKNLPDCIILDSTSMFNEVTFREILLPLVRMMGEVSLKT